MSMNRGQNLEPLPDRFNRNGFSFIKIKENDNSFIYEVWGYGKKIFFDVFKKVIKPETVIRGKVLPAKIKYPSKEDFGKWAWNPPVLSDEPTAWEAAISRVIESS